MSDGQKALRAELEVAITAEREARMAVAAAAEDLQRGRQLAADAGAEVEAKSAAIVEAKQRDAAAVAAAVKMRGDAANTGATRAARHDLQLAEDAAEVAQAAVSRLEQALADAELEARFAKNDILEARNKLLRPVAEQLLEEGRAAKRTLTTVSAMLSGILAGDADAPKFANTLDSIRAQERRSAPLLGLRTALAHFAAAGPDEEGDAAAVEREMRAAVAALVTDATTKLPVP